MTMTEDTTKVVGRSQYDYVLLFLTFTLIGLGLLMIYSASAVVADDRFTSDFYFLRRQLGFLALGLLVMGVCQKIDYHVLRKLVYPILIGSLCLVALSYIPGFRSVASGAARWVKIGFIRFQPSEFAKLAIIIFMAYSLAKKGDRVRSFGVGVLPHLVVGGVVVLAVLGQKDLGGALVIASLIGILMFVGGVKPSYLISLFLLSLPVLYFAVASQSYRRKRILAFLDPWSDRYGSGFQIIQSLVSFQQGGVFGKGLGAGQQKLFYLPEAHTDFIGAVIGEELGLVGVILMVLLFVGFCCRGFQIAWNAPDLFGRYLALGLTSFVAIQAIGNLGVVMGMFPSKGMVLPFISYGGSALVVFMAAVGILLNVSKYKGSAPCMS